MVQVRRTFPLTTKVKNVVIFIAAAFVAFFVSIFGMIEPPNKYGIDSSETKRPLKKRSKLTLREVDHIKMSKKDDLPLSGCPKGG